MKIGKKIFGAITLSLVAFAMVAGYTRNTSNAYQANASTTYNYGETAYEVSDAVTDLDLTPEGKITSRWGRQQATAVWDNGLVTCQAYQQIAVTEKTGSYHTKFDLTLATASANMFGIMLRQNSGEVVNVAGDGDADIGARNGFELFTADNGFQVFYNEAGNRTNISWFQYDATNRWAEENRKYVFEIWMLNLANDSIQIIIEVDGVKKFDFNTASCDALKGKNLVKEGYLRFGNDADSSMAWSIKGYTHNYGSYVLSDYLAELDLSVEGKVTSRWGRQVATIVYDKGICACEAYQPINVAQTTGSYHTKFDLTFLTANANWFSMMLRQNSGVMATVAGDGDIDIGARNGFEIHTSDNGFSLFYNDHDARTFLKWFQYDAENRWDKNERTYVFDISVLNLADGSIQILIDVDGANKLTFNTSSVDALKDVNLPKTGQFRFGGHFQDGAYPEEETSMKYTIRGYGAGRQEIGKTVYELADTLTEWDISGDNAIVSKWGNQPATVEYKDGEYVVQPGQPVNGNVMMGSYHTKFDLTFGDNHTGGLVPAFNMMLRQNSGSLENGIDVGKRTGYEIFASNHYFQFFYNTNNDRVGLNPGGFLYDDADHLGPSDKTYTFEIWVLNLVDGSVQIIIDVDGSNKLNYNSSNDAGVTPIKTGTVRMCGSFDDLLGKGIILKGHELNETSYPYTIDGDVPTTVEVLEEVDFGTTTVKTVFEKFDVKGALTGTVDTRTLGEKQLVLNVPGHETRAITVVGNDSAEYAIKDGFKVDYVVGEAFADDLVLVKTVDETTKEVKVLASEVSGFDSSSHGVKQLTVAVAGQSLQVNVKVWAYEIDEASKAKYVVDEFYQDGDIVVNKVCGEEAIPTPIEVDDITSFDNSVSGHTTITFTKFGTEFTHNVDVVTYDIQDGYKSQYKVGEPYAEDVVVIEACGEDVTPIQIGANDITGFDTSKAGDVEVSIPKYNMSFTISVTVNEYTVTFDSDGGSAVASQTVQAGNKASKPADPTKAGFKFDGWTLNGQPFDFNTAITGDVTLKAKWSVLTCVVTFDSAGGSSVASSTVNFGEKVSKPADPTKEGFVFDGWYNGSTAYDFNSAVEGDLTLTAHWKVEEKKPSGGCGGSVIAASGLVTLLSIAGIALLKKKHD